MRSPGKASNAFNFAAGISPPKMSGAHDELAFLFGKQRSGANKWPPSDQAGADKARADDEEEEDAEEEGYTC